MPPACTTFNHLVYPFWFWVEEDILLKTFRAVGLLKQVGVRLISRKLSSIPMTPNRPLCLHVARTGVLAGGPNLLQENLPPTEFLENYAPSFRLEIYDRDEDKQNENSPYYLSQVHVL